MARTGVHVHKKTTIEKVTENQATGKYCLHSTDGETYPGFDVVLMAIGECEAILFLY